MLIRRSPFLRVVGADMSKLSRIVCVIALGCSPVVAQDYFGGYQPVVTTAYQPYSTVSQPYQAGPVYGSRYLPPPSYGAYPAAPRFANRVANFFRPRPLFNPPLIRRPLVQRPLLGRPLFPRLRQRLWRPRQFMPTYAASYSAVPIAATGAIASVPMAACQSACMPIQCDCACPTACEEPRYETVERTVMVPKLVEEQQKYTEVTYDRVPKQREVTVYETVPVTRTVAQREQVWEPETKTRREQYTVMKPVTVSRPYEVTVAVPERVRRTGYRTEYRPEMRSRVEEYTEMVPQRVRKTASRKVCTTTPVTRMQTYTQRSGHWETQQVAVNRPLMATVAATTVSAASGLGGCSPCVPVSCGCQTEYMTRQVFVPETVQVQRPVTTYQSAMVDQPYSYDEITYKPVKRQRTVQVQQMKTVRVPYEYTEVVYRDKKETRTEQVQRMVPERHERTVEYVEMVPKTKTRNVKVTEYREVARKKTETYTALVPREVERVRTVQGLQRHAHEGDRAGVGSIVRWDGHSIAPKLPGSVAHATDPASASHDASETGSPAVRGQVVHYGR